MKQGMNPPLSAIGPYLGVGCAYPLGYRPLALPHFSRTFRKQKSQIISQSQNFEPKPDA